MFAHSSREQSIITTINSGDTSLRAILVIDTTLSRGRMWLAAHEGVFLGQPRGVKSISKAMPRDSSV